MKKIKSIHQLKAEKKRIKDRQAELERSIRSNWSALKESVQPSHLAKEAFSKATDNTAGTNDGNILKSTFTYAMTMLAKKLADKAEDKLGKLFAGKKRK
jgi:cell division septum initiation protein DivIVA